MQVAWARLNRAAATALLASARGEPGDHVNANGDVVLDAEPLLQSMAAQKGPLADLLAQRQAREIVLVKASELDPLRRAADASDLAPPVLIALAIVLLGLGAITARTAAGALATTFVCLLGGCAGVLVGVPGRPRPGAREVQLARWPTRSSPRRSTPPSARSRSSSAAPAWWRSDWSPWWPACGPASAPCNAAARG